MGCLDRRCSQICGTLSPSPSRCVPQQLECNFQKLLFVCASRVAVEGLWVMNSSRRNYRPPPVLARRVRQTDAGTHTSRFFFLLPIVAEALLFVVLVDLRSAFAESSKSWGSARWLTVVFGGGG